MEAVLTESGLGEVVSLHCFCVLPGRRGSVQVHRPLRKQRRHSLGQVWRVVTEERVYYGGRFALFVG